MTVNSSESQATRRRIFDNHLNGSVRSKAFESIQISKVLTTVLQRKTLRESNEALVAAIECSKDAIVFVSHRAAL